MKQYHDILNELHLSIEKITTYQQEVKKLQEIIEKTTKETQTSLDSQDLKLDVIKNNMSKYINDYQISINNIALGVSNDFREITNKSVTSIKNDLTDEINAMLLKITDALTQVYGNLNQERQELIDKINESLNINRNEGSIIKGIKSEIDEQNEYLSSINKETKNNIKMYFDEIKNLKSEIELLKDNFELKYVFNKKRITLTTIFSFLMVLMISISIITATYMFSYYSRLIFFPNRVHTLVIGILMCLLCVGLVTLLLLVILRPPTFTRVRKAEKNEEK